MQQPSVFPFGIRIDEPVTTLTDVLVAVVCFYAWIKLRKIRIQNPELPFFRWFFLLMGLATLIGGVIGHGFLYAFSFEWKLPGWLISMVSITLLERAVIVHSRSLLRWRVVRFFYWFNIIELITFAALAFYFLNFRFVEAHSAYGLMMVVLGFCLFNLRKGRNTKAIRLLISGVGVAVLAAVIFTARIGLGVWFNHVDISHILMAGTAVLFYLGARDIARGKTSGFSGKH